ncbi:MAG: cytidyltransferase [Caloramator sp.]|nr:cytidyltransferase [Caloramator sp.]
MFGEFIDLILKSRIITSSSIYKKLIDMLNTQDFKNNLNEASVNRDYSCKRCYICLEEIIKTFYKKDDDFLFAVYQYALSKSFKEAVTLELDEEDFAIYETYLILLKVFSKFQKLSNDDSFQSRYPLFFLGLDEERILEDPTEYKRFVEAFEGDYVYEMMKLNQEIIGYNTLDHVCGVHYLSLYIARQAKVKNLPIDLGRISGAAAGHDIGKFGCKGVELKRVPYLHYYYTDVWFKKHNINYIRNIAINHSTWDLELENLSIESLILIYSDFRVKNKKIDNKEQMYIYSLDESFDVILNKLDNVDEKKILRYKKVYSKLKDFENYLLDLGINVSLDDLKVTTYKDKCYSLMFGEDVVENIKYQAISHNINLMHKLRSEFSLNEILENARNAQDSQSLRAYLDIIEEYSTYLTQKQKIITLGFLYEQLMHNEEDIRRQAAELLGLLIASFDEEYRKELPENAKIDKDDINSIYLFKRYVSLMLTPDHKIIDTYKEWIGYSLSVFIKSIFDKISENQKLEYKFALQEFYNRDNLSKEIELYLLDAAKYIPLKDEDSLFYDFLIKRLLSERHHIRIMALDTLYVQLKKHTPSTNILEKIKQLFMNEIKYSATAPENFLKLNIAEKLGIETIVVNEYLSFYIKNLENITDIFLSNLKTATSWITKKIQIDILLDYALKNPKERGLQTALHFCNLLKVSAVEAVRNKAGESILNIIKFLPMDQRNEIAVELVRALEMEGYRFTKYIPNYLGKIILYLPFVELNEFLDDSYEKIKTSNTRVSSLILKTSSVALSNINIYKTQVNKEEEYIKILNKLISILLSGLINYNNQIKQFALNCIGVQVFGSKTLSLEDKNEIFNIIAKKFLSIIGQFEEDELLFLVNSAALNHIYRFISEQNIISKIKLDIPKRIAFMPGTFDPFSLSHKEIAKAIRDLGFEVYIAIDEFSWSKKTLPNLIRRTIAALSIADENNIFLFPETQPINISNPKDIRRLKDIFKDFDVYIVVGSDVVINASAYKKPKEQDSIHTLNHLIFERRSKNEYSQEMFEEAVKNLEGDVIKLNLPPQYEDISSTQIRDSIDENRDISNLVDPLVQKYIYENGFYRREPQYKSLLTDWPLEFEVVEEYKEAVVEKLSHLLRLNFYIVKEKMMKFFAKPSARLLIAIDKENDSIAGFSAFHWLRSNSFYVELNDTIISNFLRENAVGRIICIDGMYIDKNSKIKELPQLILTETVSFCISKDYDYAIYKNLLDIKENFEIQNLLLTNGFIEVKTEDIYNKCYAVNMNYPISLLLDIETIIKEPYRNTETVKNAINKTRENLKRALIKLYPGHLVLIFERDVIYKRLVQKICRENGVPTYQMTPRTLGPLICVPYGNILRRNIVPNTVTKALHTEKLFNPNLKNFKIGPYPNYLSLELQIKTIASFDRPIILVDDILHKGYRIKALDPILKAEKIDVHKIIVGILSGQGKEIMDIQNREVDCAYFIPKLRAWFYEDALYPFIGGDTLFRGSYPQRNLIPSVNLILPYAVPTFLKGASAKDIFNLSKVCIENAKILLEAIEQEYEAINERSLTLQNIGDALVYPRYPEHGKFMYYDLTLSPSVYLKNDLEQLEKLEPILT